MRKIIAFLLPLIIVTTSFASALPKETPEDVARDILRKNPASNDWKMENVSARLGQVSADLTQRAAANGSMYQAVEHVAVPANTTEVAKVALDLLKKGTRLTVGGLAFAGTVDALLHAVGYLQKEGSLVKKSDGTLTDPNNYKGHYIYILNTGVQYSDINAAGSAFCDYLKGLYGWSHVVFLKATPDDYSPTVVCSFQKDPTSDQVFTQAFGMNQIKNPNYDPSVSPDLPDTVPVPDSEAIPTLAQLMNADTTGKYDPIVQYAYTPKESDGVTPKPATYVDWGVNGFTPEMSQNLIDNRNAILQAQLTQQNYDAINQAVKDPTQTATTTTPDGQSQSTTTKPDGTKVTTSTQTFTDPKTGQQTTTTTVTTTKPDGTQSTEQTNTTADNIKTKTDLPAFCDYFSSLCKWLDWTQEQPTDSDKEDGHVDVDSPNNFDFSVFRTDRVSASHTCPAPTQVNLNLMTASVSYEFDYSPFCHFLELIHPIVIAIGWLSAAYILLGYTRDG